jgi:NADPH:quinone reductase-like Zn-dependent oxidoreductase
VGGLNLSSKPTVVELAEVVAIGEGVGGINVGDRVFVKAWALDVITHNKETYYFVNVESGGILATYEETL